MLSKYNKNSIITGPLDSYCLICESYLRGQNDISLHIDKPIHLKNLESVPYFEKYKDDHIRKVKTGYYCEFCNKLFSTAAKVGLHVSETQHMQNKGLQLLKRTSNGVVAFGNVFISDGAWNGFVDGTCSLCNTEFESESIHKTSQTHVLNLIKINIEFVNNSLYRKIDEETFHCLTCNDVIASQNFSDHFKSLDHETKHKQCCNLGILASASEDVGKAESNQVKEEKPKVHTATNANGETSKKHTNARKENSKTDKNSVTAKEFDAILLDAMNASKDYIKTHGVDGLMYCMICEWLLERGEIPSHVKGEHHLTMLKMHKDRLEKKSRVEEKPSKDLSNGDVNHSGNDANRDKVLDCLPEIQRNDINVDFVSGTAVCKKCAKDLSLDYDVIKSHIDEHKANPNKKETRQNPFQYNQKGAEGGKNTTLYTKPVLLRRNEDEAQSSRRSSLSSKDEEEIEAFAAQHNMRYSNRKVFCNLCQAYLPISIKNLRQHVEGMNHKMRMAKSDTVATTKSRDLKKVTISDFVKSVVGIENVLFQDVVINEKLCLNTLSFLFLKSENNRWKCYCCDKWYGLAEIERHKTSDGHKEKMASTMIVLVDSEFIREVQTDVYHCGFCNIVEFGWDSMQEHLVTVQHRECKNAADWRLRQHKPQMRRHEMRQHMQMMALMHMISSRNDSSNDSDSDWY